MSDPQSKHKALPGSRSPISCCALRENLVSTQRPLVFSIWAALIDPDSLRSGEYGACGVEGPMRYAGAVVLNEGLGPPKRLVPVSDAILVCDGSSNVILDNWENDAHG